MLLSAAARLQQCDRGNSSEAVKADRIKLAHDQLRKSLCRNVGPYILASWTLSPCEALRAIGLRREDQAISSGVGLLVAPRRNSLPALFEADP